MNVEWSNGVIRGRSPVRLVSSQLWPAPEHARWFPVHPNGALQFVATMKVDAEGFDLRLKDAFGTLLLEWRFDAEA